MKKKIQPKKAIPTYTRMQVPDAERCRFTSTHRRRCVNPHGGSPNGLCVVHARHFEKMKIAEARAVSKEVLGTEEEFQSREGVNRVITRLFSLVLEGRIPRREGTLLAYIASLLLQTIPHAGERVPEGWENYTRELFDELPSPSRDDLAERDDLNPAAQIPNRM